MSSTANAQKKASGSDNHDVHHTSSSGWGRWGFLGPSMHPPGGVATSDWIFETIIFVVLGAWAASVSWNYNSTYYTMNKGGAEPMAKYSWWLKTVYAIFAFYFGPIYLLLVMISDREFYRNVLINNIQNLGVEQIQIVDTSLGVDV